MRIAVLGDIHSNDLALEAVLHDIRGAQVDSIIQLGDALNGPVNPRGVARMLRGMDATHIRGNGDRMILMAEGQEASKSALFARALLSADDLAFVSTWKATGSGEGWLAFHGSPRSDTEYLLEDVSSAGVRIKGAAAILEMLGDARAPLVLCGHTHVPRVVHLPGGMLVVNPGSVGLQAYGDDFPVPHKMETGSPAARYAVLESSEGGWRVSLRAIPYDWQQAATIADQNGFPDWAHSMRTGYA